MSEKEKPLGFRQGLLLFFVLGIAAFKWSVIGWYRADDFLLGLGVELCFWGWLTVVCEIIARRSEHLASLVFYPAFLFTASFVFSYTYFFDSAVERKFSLLDTDMGGMVFFLRDVLPLRGFIILTTLVAFTVGGALIVRKRGRRPALAMMLASLTLLTLITVWRTSAAERVATPLYDIVHDYKELWTTPRVQSAAEPLMPATALDKSDRVPQQLETPFKKVLIFVMETMTSERLARESKALKQDTLFASGRAHSHLFDRYFPNNQDSRTGMLDILGSRLIPYEAYRDADVAAYEGVTRLPSLVDAFKRFGYKTAFAVSQTELEEVVRDLPWDHAIHLHDDEIPALKKTKLCFAPYEFENSCEDAALLPKVFDFIDNNERAFLFQEFLWGHASEYNEASGRTNTEYYSSYVDQVIAHLKEKNLLDETLIAITSDHGFRDKGLQDQISVYRIPLQFYAQRFSETHETALLSHLDFKDLLLNEMQAGSVPVDKNRAVLIQGPTATALFAAMTDDGDFMLVKTRGDARLLLRHENSGSSVPSAVMRLRDDYKALFDARIKQH